LSFGTGGEGTSCQPPSLVLIKRKKKPKEG